MSLDKFKHAEKQTNGLHKAVALTWVHHILLQLLVSLLFQLAKVVHHLRTQCQNVEQHVRQAHLVGVLDALEFLEQSCFFRRAVLRLRHLADYDAAHQGVIVALWRFLAANYHWCIHLVVLYFPAWYAPAFLFSVAIVHDAFQRLELHIGNILIVILVENNRYIAECAHDGRHGRVCTCVKIEYRHSWRNEQRAYGYAYLRLSRRHRTHEEWGGKQPVDAVDIAAECAHDCIKDGPLAVVVDLVDLVHQVGPLLEWNFLLFRHFLINQLGNKFVLIRLTATACVNGGKGRKVIVLLVVRDNTQLVYRAECRLVIYHVENTVGEGEEHSVRLSASPLLLLISVNLNLGAHYEVSAHVFAYFRPVLLLAIGEVHRLEVNQNLLYRRLFQEHLRSNLDIQWCWIIPTVDA